MTRSLTSVLRRFVYRATPFSLLKAVIAGAVLFVVIPALAMVSHLRSLDGQDSLAATIGALPLRPEASLIKTVGPYRVVSLPDRPTRLVGVESLRGGPGETQAWGQEQFESLQSGTPFAARLSYTTATDDNLELLASHSSLQFLALDSTRITDAGMWHLRRLPRVLFLSVGDTAVTDVGADTIAGMRTLASLNLRGSRITSHGLSKLALLENLQALNIAETGVAGDGLAYLTVLGQLTGLNASGLRIGDDDVEHLCRLLNLEHLDLSHTGITDRGLLQLASLHSLRNLRIDGIPITEVGLTAFRQARPDVAILHRGDCFSNPIDW